MILGVDIFRKRTNLVLFLSFASKKKERGLLSRFFLDVDGLAEDDKLNKLPKFASESG